MIFPRILLIAVSLLCVGLSAEPESPQSHSSVSTTKHLSYGNEILFSSRILSREISINIYLPQTFHQASKQHRYPVIFINGTHGKEFFHALTGVVKHLSSVERMPESIVISLNDGGDEPETYLHRMWTHTTEEKFSAQGDPEAYSKFLTEELFPYLESNYRALNNRMIIGVSTSSIFPLYALTSKPGLFQSYFFLSAADIFGMGPTSESTFIDEITTSMQTSSNKISAFYFAMADSDMRKDKRYDKILSQINTKLSPYVKENLKLKIEVLNNENHYGAFIKAALTAIELNYPHEEWSANYRELISQPGNALQNIDHFYESLSQKYGFPILPRATRWRNVNKLSYITSLLLKDGRIQEAISVARRWVEYRPNSIDAHQSLAQALQQNDEISEASDILKKALEISRNQDNSKTAAINRQLTELKLN
ncbi:alpha/beta hydrolase-fold protein [Microbulbifer sp. EKSA008]|uniref:alpha/beta hydrolase-fold protein n=1 Tax=Microbulbifer sp. EKSA008 TaxID=3243367 RepID=UPI004042EE5E